jgi:hypothetical protein
VRTLTAPTLEGDTVPTPIPELDAYDDIDPDVDSLVGEPADADHDLDPDTFTEEEDDTP